MNKMIARWLVCTSAVLILTATGCGDGNLSGPGTTSPSDYEDVIDDNGVNEESNDFYDDVSEGETPNDDDDASTETDVDLAPDSGTITPDPDPDPKPDPDPEPDPEPDPKPDPEPDPEPEPTWNCANITCGPVDSATTSLGKMKALDACAFEMALQHPLSTGTKLADKLIARLKSENIGSAVALNTVMKNLNRDGQSGLSSTNNTRLKGMGASGFRWNSGDINVDYWMPQGITGSSDAVASGVFNGRKYIMMAWYHKTTARPTRGVRISIADITDLKKVTYRHMLLVDPIETNGKANFQAAEYDSGNALHAGGIVWYGDYLYVADTSQGLRIYDLSRIFKISKYDQTAKIGISAGRSDAHGYLYAIPRIARYKRTKNSCAARFSFVGLDRTSNPPTLTTGNYISNSTAGQVITWPLDPQTHLLETRQGTTRASHAAVIGQTRTQGALRVGNDYYFSNSSQDGSYGRLYINRPGQTSRHVKWINGTEDIYYDRQTKRLWTPSEHPGRRDVVSIPRANVK